MTTVLARAGLVAIALAVATVAPDAQSGYDLFQKALATERADGNLKDAIELYERVVRDSSHDRPLVARALLRIASCYEKLDERNAVAVYERIVRDFIDQADSAAAARVRLAVLRPPRSSSSQAARQLWIARHGDSVVGNVPSFDGRFVGFTVEETGDLGLHDFTNGTNRILASPGQSGDRAGGSSAVSRDSRSIAYTWMVNRTSRNELRVLSFDRARARPRTIYRSQGALDAMYPYGWTPDGRYLFVVRVLPDRTSQLAIVAVSDGSLRVIKSLPWQSPRGSLSPDARHIVYYTFDDKTGARSIFVLAVDGSHEHLVTQGKNESTPVWAADGSAVLFIDSRTGVPSLWRTEIEQGTPHGNAELVKADVGSIELLSVTRTGALYYIASGSRRGNIYTASLGPDRKVQGRPELAIESFINSNVGPSVSPDGKYLAYYSNNRAAGRLKIRTLQTGEERAVPVQVEVGPMIGAGPMWLPDGKSFLALTIDLERGGYTISEIKASDGSVHVVRRFPTIPMSAAVSPDGTTLFFSVQDADDGRSGRLTRMDLDTHLETDLRVDGLVTSLAVSPDAKELAFIGSERSSSSAHLAIIPASGGASREMFRAESLNGASGFATLSWTPDGNHLLFVQSGGTTNSTNTVWRVAAAGGVPEQVGISITGPIKEPQMHPDGRRLFFFGSEAVRAEIWALESFLSPRR